MSEQRDFCAYCGKDAERPVVGDAWHCNFCGEWQKSAAWMRTLRNAGRDAVIKYGDALERLALR